MMPVAICQCIEKAAMPWFTRFEGHLETEPPVGVYRFAGRPRGRDRDGSGEVTVAIGGAQMLVCFGPLRGDPATAHDLARFHLENIGKVAAQRDLELEGYRLHAIVDDVEILVHAAADRPAEGEAQGARRDRAVFGEDRPIGQRDARCVVADGAAVQQFPEFAIRINPPTADNARI
jgi:hypothetical protein